MSGAPETGVVGGVTVVGGGAVVELLPPPPPQAARNAQLAADAKRSLIEFVMLYPLTNVAPTQDERCAQTF